MGKLGSLIAAALLCAAGAHATPTFTWPFEKLAQAPVVAACVVETISVDATPSPKGTVPTHALLRVLRSFPPLKQENIVLNYDAPAESGSFSDAPQLHQGDILVFPLKLNPTPSRPWRLFADQGIARVVPTIRAKPPFAVLPADGRGFLLLEIASTLVGGSRRDLVREAGYLSEQNGITPDLLPFLESKLLASDDRWALIAAAFLSSFGIPRPTVAELRAGNFPISNVRFSGALITPVLQKLVSSQQGKESLIHQLLIYSDTESWGVGMTLPEFAHEPSLVRELCTMLRVRRPGALSVAYNMLKAGQKEVLDDSTVLSFHYLATPGADNRQLQPACWVIRDFGNDEQFGRLLALIQNSQYRDQGRYEELWRNLIWSDNPRERAVLDILLKDDRMSQANMPYSEIARGELRRVQQLPH